MAEKKKYNSILISGRKDQTLTYSKYVKDEESGESVKESLDKKVNVTDELTTQQIKDGAITNEKMAADSVGNTNLQDGSVSNEKLEDESITNEKLAENSITKDKLKDNTIGVEKLDPELRQTINAATGLPENLVETIQNVDDTLKDHQSQLDDKQSQIDDKQQQITANEEDISLLQTRSTQMEETIKSIAATGGASVANTVAYTNTTSGLISVNAQGAIDELAAKNKSQDETMSTKADKSEVNTELAKKFDKESILQESGEAEDKVISQKAISTKLNSLSLKFTVVSLFDYSNVTIGKSINPSDGTISDVIKNYKLVKLHLLAGKYWIYSGCGSSSQATLWKYSDNSYASPEKEIVGSTGTTPYNQILTLEEGYYAFCWNDGNGNGISLGKAFITDSMSVSGLIDDKVENGTKDIKNSLTNVENMSFKPSIVSVFDKSDIIVGKYLNPTNKTISDAIKNYKLVKLHLLAKKYWLYIKNTNSSQGILWKFTDETFSSVESEIIGAAPSNTISKILTLEEGYYAFCWNDGSSSINIGNAFITDSLSTQVLIDDSIKENTKDIRESLKVIENTPIPTVMSLFSKKDISLGKYIKGNEGTISSAIKSYKLVKLHLKSGKYWIYINNANSTQDILWKYSSETYEEPEKKIIGSAPSSIINKVITLEEGYYAFCWNDGSSDSILPNRAFFTDNISTQMLIDESSTNIKNELNQKINSFGKSYGNLISDFSDFDILNNAFSISEDKASAQSLLTGYENRLQYNTNLYEDKFILSSTLKIIDTDSLGYFEFCIGFWYQLAGTMFGIGKDENGSYISVYIVGQTLPPKQTHKYYISELVFVKGKEYTISIEKKTENNSYFNISVTAQDGISVSKDGIGNGEVISGDTANEGNGSINGYAWGKLSFYALIGKMRVSNVCFGYPIDMNDVKLVIVGHSFIEGNSIPSDKDKRFASLLCSSIGDRKTIILGQGGASVNSIKPHIDMEMKWLKDARYVLFCIGTNDIDSQATCTGLQYIDDAATKNGIRTIWLTVPPKYGTGDNHPVINDYIRSHFHYVEIKDVFYNNDGGLDKNMFLSDNIHPSIEGHKRIYNLIKARCSFLKTI
jgi:lysophospholipase L1-like esterase